MGSWRPTHGELVLDSVTEPTTALGPCRTCYGLQEIIDFKKEEGNYRVEDIAKDKAMEDKAAKLIDFKKMNAQRCGALRQEFGAFGVEDLLFLRSAPRRPQLPPASQVAAPRIQRMACPTNTSVRTVFFFGT